MSIFNHRTNLIESYIEREKRRQAKEAEEVALEALQIGLAFSDEEGEEEAGSEQTAVEEEEESWLENPQFDAALRAFAQMEKVS